MSFMYQDEAVQDNIQIASALYEDYPDMKTIQDSWSGDSNYDIIFIAHVKKPLSEDSGPLQLAGLYFGVTSPRKKETF